MRRGRVVYRQAISLSLAGAFLLLAVYPTVPSVAHDVRSAVHAEEQPRVGSAPAPPAPLNATVWTNDSPSFHPSSLNVSVGQLLRLTLVNRGNYSHTFTLAANGSMVFASTISPQNLSRYFQLHPPLLNVSMTPGSTHWANLTMNSSSAGGHFEYVSLTPYQFQAGMFGFIGVNAVPVGAALSFFTNGTNAYQFTPDTLDASSVAGLPVALTIYVGNLGSLGHTFWLSPLPNYNLSVGNFTTFSQQHAPLASLTLPSGPSSYANGSFVVRTPGYYEFVCTISGHFANGMFGFLYVGVPVPQARGPPSTALVQASVLAGGATLLAFGLLLAVIAAYTGRLNRPGPPEHGYGPH